MSIHADPDFDDDFAKDRELEKELIDLDPEISSEIGLYALYNGHDDPGILFLKDFHRAMKLNDSQKALSLLQDFARSDLNYFKTYFLPNSSLFLTRRVIGSLYYLQPEKEQVILLLGPTKDALKRVLNRMGVTHTPGIDSVVLYEDPRSSDIEAENRRILDTSVALILKAMGLN